MALPVGTAQSWGPSSGRKGSAPSTPSKDKGLGQLTPQVFLGLRPPFGPLCLPGPCHLARWTDPWGKGLVPGDVLRPRCAFLLALRLLRFSSSCWHRCIIPRSSMRHSREGAVGARRTRLTLKFPHTHTHTHHFLWDAVQGQDPLPPSPPPPLGTEESR